MKEHRDFSKGTRGRFYRPDAVFHLRVYVDREVETYLAAKASAKGIERSDLVNDPLKRESEMTQATG